MRHMRAKHTGRRRAGKHGRSLRRENEELRQQLAGSGRTPTIPTGFLAKLGDPSRLTISRLCLGALVLLVIAFFAGYIPLHRRSVTIAKKHRPEGKLFPAWE